MPGPAFDPSGAVRFDMKNGTTSDTRGARLVLVPATALEALERTTPGALAHIGSEVGKACGARVAGRLGGDSNVRGSTLEVVISHLAGELAIAGLGATHLERWGKALIIVLTNPTIASDGFIGAALSGALAASTGRDVCIAPLGREPGPGTGKDGNGIIARYFICAQPTVGKVRSLLSQGRSWSDVITALQKGIG